MNLGNLRFSFLPFVWTTLTGRPTVPASGCRTTKPVRLVRKSEMTKVSHGRRENATNQARESARCQPLSGIGARPAVSKQLPVSMPCRPFGAGKMALEGLPRPIGLAVRIDAQHDPRDFAPVG